MFSSCSFRKCDVITRGFSGYNTRWCKVILPDILKEFNPEDIAFATIFLGANDSNLPENTVQHVPLPQYKQDLKDMLEMMMVHIHFKCNDYHHSLLDSLSESILSVIQQFISLCGNKQ